MEDTILKIETIGPLSECIPRADWIDSDRVDAVDVILDQGDTAVYKVPRAGFTTSVIIAAQRRGLKILIVSPTRKIASSTVEGKVGIVGGVYCNVPGNQSCKFVQQMIKEDRFLKEMPIPKEDCSKCNDYLTCPVTEIERIDFTVATMTYAKLEALMMSEKEIERIGDKFADIDLVILDEAHTISFPTLAQVDLDKEVTIPNWLQYAINGVYKKFCILRTEHWEQLSNIKNLTESNPDRYTGFPVRITNPPSARDFHFQWEQLIQIAKMRKAYWSKEDANGMVLALKNIVMIMGGKTARISYIKRGDVDKMIMTSGQGNIQRAIEDFLYNLATKAKVCFVSGTMIECRPKFFQDFAVREITNTIFPDLRKTNAKMHIHPSKWKFSAWDANNGIERAVKEIREINEEVDHKPIFLLAMNKGIRQQLKRKLIDYTNIRVDYYRSENTMGVEQPQRIGIAVGLAHTPRHSCDPLADGGDDQERYLDSQQLRLNEVHAATWQAWCRVKDPNGQVESHLYCVGIRAEEVSDVVTWGLNRTIKASSDAEGKRIWNVEVDQELDRPIVHAEDRTSRGLNRHSIQEYMDRTQSVKSLIDHRNNSPKNIHFPYNSMYSRENVDLFGNSDVLSLHNCPGNTDELEATSFAMAMLFAGRLDCYACQRKNPGENGEYGFRRTETTTDLPSLIMEHLNGSETIGFYPFDTEDLCYYCAIDAPQRDNAMKISHFLLDNNLPVLVEKLASPESYHIWIPIIPAKTHTVYKFVRQLLHDAGAKDADVYPGQKSIDSCHKGSCGDFLMLPLGIDKEKNRISEFVDPRTFEPVDLVLVENVIRLREAPESRTAIPPVEDDQE